MNIHQLDPDVPLATSGVSCPELPRISADCPKMNIFITALVIINVANQSLKKKKRRCDETDKR